MFSPSRFTLLSTWVTLAKWNSVWDHSTASHATLSKARFLTATNATWLFPTPWLYFQLFSHHSLLISYGNDLSALPSTCWEFSCLLCFRCSLFLKCPSHTAHSHTPSGLYQTPLNEGFLATHLLTHLPCFVFLLNTLSPPNMPHTYLHYYVSPFTRMQALWK